MCTIYDNFFFFYLYILTPVCSMVDSFLSRERLPAAGGKVAAGQVFVAEKAVSGTSYFGDQVQTYMVRPTMASPRSSDTSASNFGLL